ncbi:hypothetical protein LI177_08100 [bacterium 210820-DFI.6.37]|nr:hypothetical protein [bacterium 210820-DFI.6.37]
MDVVVAAAVCLGIIGVGEIVSYFTRAFIPSMAAALLIYLLLTWGGMTKDFPEMSGFNYLGELSMLFLVVHLGTSVAPGDYIKNIKSVIVAAAALVGGLVCVVGLGGLIFGFDVMLAGAGAACGGGAIAGILAIQKLTDLGLVSLIAVPAIILGTVDLYGQPVASFLLKKFARKLNKSDAYLLEKAANKNKAEEIRLTKHGVPFGSEDNPSNRITAWIPIKLEEDGFVLFELAVLSLLAYFLESVTGINMYIYAFFLGAIGCAVGVLRMNLLDRSHSYGLVICVFITWIFSSMNDITPSALLASLGPALTILILATIGLAGGGGLAGKLLGYDFWLSAAAGMGLMFLMPGVMIVCNEVSARSARDKEEEKFMVDSIAPSMYIVANAGYIMGVAITVSCLLSLLVYF